MQDNIIMKSILQKSGRDKIADNYSSNHILNLDIFSDKFLQGSNKKNKYLNQIEEEKQAIDEKVFIMR